MCSRNKAKEIFVQITHAAQFNPGMLIKFIEQFKGYPIQGFYIVDSTGSFFPDDIVDYITAIKQNFPIKIGFHGHNHLQLAVANSLSAIDAGALFVDGCLHSIGRDAGNAQTEILAYYLNKKYQANYNLNLLIEASETIINPIIKNSTMGTDQFNIRCAINKVAIPQEFCSLMKLKWGASIKETVEAYSQIPNSFNPKPEDMKRILLNFKQD